jgi:hypothetical protein
MNTRSWEMVFDRASLGYRYTSMKVGNNCQLSLFSGRSDLSIARLFQSTSSSHPFQSTPTCLQYLSL